jgi:hypothetical protein
MATTDSPRTELVRGLPAPQSHGRGMKPARRDQLVIN